MIIRFTTNNKQNVKVIFTSIISHNFTIRLFSSYNHKKIRHTICECYRFTRLFFVFRIPVGYLRVKTFTRALRAGEILYPFPYRRVKFRTHTFTHRSASRTRGKIAIPNNDWHVTVPRWVKGGTLKPMI